MAAPYHTDFQQGKSLLHGTKNQRPAHTYLPEEVWASEGWRTVCGAALNYSCLANPSSSAEKPIFIGKYWPIRGGVFGPSFDSRNYSAESPTFSQAKCTSQASPIQATPPESQFSQGSIGQFAEEFRSQFRFSKLLRRISHVFPIGNAWAMRL